MRVFDNKKGRFLATLVWRFYAAAESLADAAGASIALWAASLGLINM